MIGPAIADMRFTFIEKICDATVVKPKESKEHLRSAKMDKILTGKYTAIPCFVAIMAAVFWLTFNVIGAALSNLLDMGISALTNGRWCVVILECQFRYSFAGNRWNL